MAKTKNIFDYEFFRNRSMTATEAFRNPKKLEDKLTEDPFSEVYLTRNGKPYAVVQAYSTYAGSSTADIKVKVSKEKKSGKN